MTDSSMWSNNVLDKPNRTVTTRELNNFIHENNLNEQAPAALIEADPQIQRIALDLGTLKDVRNASSMLLARLRDARAASINSTMSEGNDRSVAIERLNRHSMTQLHRL